MSKIVERAAQARSLRVDEAFKAICDEIRADAASVFLEAHSSPEAIAAAHDRVRAVQVFLDAIQARLDAEAIDQKRNQHRVND